MFFFVVGGGGEHFVFRLHTWGTKDINNCLGYTSEYYRKSTVNERTNSNIGFKCSQLRVGYLCCQNFPDFPSFIALLHNS